jgi:hypothetical protein
MKLVVIFFHSKIGLSCCQKTDVKISALGKASRICSKTTSAHPQSFIQSHTIAIFLFSKF